MQARQGDQGKERRIENWNPWKHPNFSTIVKEDFEAKNSLLIFLRIWDDFQYMLFL